MESLAYQANLTEIYSFKNNGSTQRVLNKGVKNSMSFLERYLQWLHTDEFEKRDIILCIRKLVKRLLLISLKRQT